MVLRALEAVEVALAKGHGHLAFLLVTAVRRRFRRPSHASANVQQWRAPMPDFDCCRNNKIPAFIPWRYKALTSTLRVEVPSHLHNILYRQGLIRPWRAVYNSLVLPPHSERVPYLSFLAGSAGSGAMQRPLQT